MRAHVLKAIAAILAVLAPGLAAADENLGCQVALCMANPSGPKALSECKPPMEKLAKRLAQGREFPKCDLGGEGETEKKGDLILFRMTGQPTRVFNYKTGQHYELAIPASRPDTGHQKDSGAVQTQVR